MFQSKQNQVSFLWLYEPWSIKKKEKVNNTDHELNEILVLWRKMFLNVKTKPHSNVILLFKNSATNMEDDQKVGRGWMYSCEIVSDTSCVVLLPPK